MASEYYSLTLADISPFLAYDPATGLFRWLHRCSHRVHIGDIAGVARPDGYIVIRITINGVKHQLRAHRLAWLFARGAWPAKEIDHINGDRSDNRIANLRIATRSQNAQNTGRPRTNTSGVKGVSWSKQYQRWEVYIWLHNRKIHLGRFDRLEDAAAAYAKAAARLHGDFARLE